MIRMKLLLLCFLASATIRGMENDTASEIEGMDLSEATFYIPQSRVQSKGNKHLFYNKEGFFVSDGTNIKHVQACDIDKDLRRREVKDIVKYCVLGKLRISELEDGGYKINSIGELKGGGAFGAWLGSTVGYGLVTFAGHGALLGVSFLAGPAQPAALVTLEKMFAIPIHSVACAAGVAGGVVTAVATGPV